MAILDSLLIEPTYRTAEGEILSTQEGAIAKATEFATSLASLYSGVKMADSQADILKYQYQMEAMRNQFSAPTYDAQSLAAQATTAGFGQPNGGLGNLVMLGLVAGAVYLLAKG